MTSIAHRNFPHSPLARSAANLSLDLALAIGWSQQYASDPDVRIFTPDIGEPYTAVWFEGAWRKFDYRDNELLHAICQQYPCKVTKTDSDYVAQCASCRAHASGKELAITLALIGHLQK